MNFNYSYRAFLITSLLVGNLILVLISVKLKKKGGPTELESAAIEYIEMIPEDFEDRKSSCNGPVPQHFHKDFEEMALTEQEKVDIQTNTAYNEAEQFIREIENSRNSEFDEATETPESQFDFEASDIDFSKAQKALEEVKETLEESASKIEKRTSNEVNRKTTITYNLKDRNALDLPNPVYTCDTGGKIVISIVVDALGKIEKATYNPTLSSSTNGCLIDAALEYTQQSRFTTKADRDRQLGTITYLFPGQE